MSALRKLLLLAALVLASAVAGAASLSESPASIPNGGTVTATWSGISSPTSTDWIGLYTPGAPHSPALSWRYTTGAALGNVPFAIPTGTAAGTYQLRLFANDGYTLLATSANFAVVQPSVTASAAVVAPGGTANAAWSNIGAPTSTDWIGLYTPGAPDSPAITWRYTSGAASGSVPFTMPPGAAFGTYQLRLFANNGYAKLATSGNFAIGPSLSGTVTVGGAPLAGVGFSAPGGACSASNSAGQYTCLVPPGFTGNVTPSLNGHLFDPAQRSYTNVTASQSAQNYAEILYQVSGTLSANGAALAGVTMSATNGVSCSASNSSGQYSCTVGHGWSGSVTPSLEGYGFTPGARSYSALAANQTAEDFAGAVSGAAERIFYVHVDHLNTPRLIADQQGRAVWRWEQQEPFGVNAPDENPSGLGTFEFPLRFPGQYFDKETNLHYNYFRDYDPDIGRYVQSDPIGLGGGLNTFLYANGNPLSYIDPKGEAGLGGTLVIGGIAMGVGIAISMSSSSNKGAGSSSKSDAQCPPNERDEYCEKVRQREEALCVAIAGPRYPGNPQQAIAICMKAAFQRYIKCRQGLPEHEWPPLTGVDTPI